MPRCCRRVAVLGPTLGMAVMLAVSRVREVCPVDIPASRWMVLAVFVGRGTVGCGPVEGVSTVFPVVVVLVVGGVLGAGRACSAALEVCGSDVSLLVGEVDPGKGGDPTGVWLVGEVVLLAGWGGRDTLVSTLVPAVGAVYCPSNSLRMARAARRLTARCMGSCRR